MALLTGPAHFIYLGGEIYWQHLRAIRTAHVHGVPVWFHAVGIELEKIVIPSELDVEMPCEFRPLELPDWLRDHPVQLANVKDYYAWNILHEYGGIYLDLDTISLRPAWDLLTADVCVSREYPETSDHSHPFNSAVVLAERGAPVLADMAAAALLSLEAGVSQWGSLGPRLLTDMVTVHPEAFSVAPYRALNGWSYHDIDDYYANPHDPGPSVRVIHLYSSDHLGQFLADRWTP